MKTIVSGTICPILEVPWNMSMNVRSA